MKKKKTIWRKVKASRRKVRVFRRWIWQKPLDAFLWVVGLIGVVLFVVLILVMFNECVECWAKEVLGVGRKKDAIQFIALGIAGVLAIFGAVAVSRRAVAQTKIAEAEARNNELTEKGHVQERFKAAVEHLGCRDESVRIGSFYEFFRLASDNKELRKNIFDILRAHLRRVTNSDKYKEEIGVIGGAKKNIKDVRTTEEVQCLLDALFRSKDSQGKFVFTELKPTLQGIFLVQGNLYRADIHGATLQNMDLQCANLQEADLRGVDMQGVDMQGAELQGADLQRANLQGAKLRDADLFFADLRGADLKGTELQDTDLREVNFEQAELQTANMQGADLREADLRDVDLWKADLRGAYLWDANLQDVKNLETARLSGAKVKGAKRPEGFEWPKDVDND